MSESVGAENSRLTAIETEQKTKLQSLKIGLALVTVAAILFSGMIFLINTQNSDVKNDLKDVENALSDFKRLVRSDLVKEIRRIELTNSSHKDEGHRNTNAKLAILDNASAILTELTQLVATQNERIRFLEKNSLPAGEIDSRISQVSAEAKRANVAAQDLRIKFDALENSVLSQKEIDSRFENTDLKIQGQGDLLQEEINNIIKNILDIEK